MARPTKLTPEVTGRILTAIAGGNTRRTAAAYAGIAESTLFDWLERGRATTRGRFSEFSEAVTKAEADAVVASVGRIRQAATDNWRAAAWWLEHRHPDDWGPHLEIDGGVTVLIREYDGIDPNQVS